MFRFPFTLKGICLLAIIALLTTIAAGPNLLLAEEEAPADADSLVARLAAPPAELLSESQRTAVSNLGTINAVNLDAAKASVFNNLLTIRNLRIDSNELGLNDYAELYYLLDTETLQFVPSGFSVVEGLGTYNIDESYFSKDITSEITVVEPDATALSSDSLHRISSDGSDTFQMDLEAGMVITFRFYQPSDDFEFQFYRPDGSLRESSFLDQGTNWYAFNRVILQSGTYSLKFIPQNDASVSLNLGFTNNNRKSLEDIAAGDNISVSLPGWGREFAKYRIQLNRGDFVEVSGPSDGDITLALTDSIGQIIQQTSPGKLNARIYEDGVYYLFVKNRDFGTGSSYSGSITVTPDADLGQYPTLGSIADQQTDLSAPFSLTFSATNGPVQYEIGGLPQGLTFDPNTGTISGAPESPGTYQVAVSAENSYGLDRTTFQLTVNDDGSAITPLLTNVTEISLDGVVSVVNDNAFKLYNPKASSDTTTLSDYLELDSIFDLQTQKLMPTNLGIVQDIGFYNQSRVIFSKDITSAVEVSTPDSETLASDTLHSITSDGTADYELFLEAGMVLTFRYRNPSDDFEVRFINPDGTLRSASFIDAGANWYATNRAILETGLYKIRFVPQNDATVSLDFGVTNGNRKPTQVLNDGDSISVSLTGWGREFAKYQVELNQGDFVEVSRPSDSDIELILTDSDGHVRASTAPGKLNEKVYEDGTYYLFVKNSDFDSGSSYSGTITITPDPDVDQYPDISPITNQQAEDSRIFLLQVTASNNPTSYTAGGLPTGLTMSEDTGLIFGTPKLTGTFPVRVLANNDFGRDTLDFFISVQSCETPEDNCADVYVVYLPTTVR